MKLKNFATGLTVVGLSKCLLFALLTSTHSTHSVPSLTETYNVGVLIGMSIAECGVGALLLFLKFKQD